ncbi:MAG: putative tryptophan/tyrosine transport system substrate-binding protein [Candidatus Dependentiae bacterium]|nr:putative tryptophan/tyrosine transport system substrate-binding protein [Candidatus Dependentiae bacterium]
MAKPIRIGIIYHPDNVEHSSVANQFAKLLALPSEENDFFPGLLPTKLNTDSLRSRVVLREDGVFAFYISIGTFFTVSLSNAYKNVEPTPTLFVGVADPVAAGVVQSLDRPGGSLSGVIMELDSLMAYAEILVHCYPWIKRVLLPYKRRGVGGLLKERALASATYLLERGFEVHLAPVDSTSEAMIEVEKCLTDVDSILLLEGCISAQIVPQLVRLCYRFNKRLFANIGKAGIALGAAFSYGADYGVVVQEGVRMIHRHFDTRKPMETMSVRMVPNNRVLYINETVLRMIGDGDEFIERLRKMADGITIVMVKYWPTPPPVEEESRLIP